MSLVIATSTVNDGNMLDRHNKSNPSVIANRKRFLSKHGININQTSRVNIEYDSKDFCRYRKSGALQIGDGMFDAGKVIADALIVTEPNHALFLPIADCAGVIIYDKTTGTLMLSHLGRHSIDQNGGYKSIRHLVENYGCQPKNIKIWLSPIPNAETYPLFSFNNRSISDVLLEQITTAGVPSSNIVSSSIDNAKHPDYFSHSEFLKGKQENDDRFAVVAMIN